MQMQRPAECHTSALQTPNDKEQALQVSDPGAAGALQKPSGRSGHTVRQGRQNGEMFFHLLSFLLNAPHLYPNGLYLIQMGPDAQATSSLPYTGGTDLGQDRVTILNKFAFLLSCLRRDSHKIDSFLKVLRCRAVKLQPELC
ncbi:hypothetical protein XENOCAPTIV_017667 [Xenoophorus captivus]|uniref:Prolactin n=1 Tax=Xenoophorus captivus TaxID=1517983 RepID=A0ABV0QTM6_9TELE